MNRKFCYEEREKTSLNCTVSESEETLGSCKGMCLCPGFTDLKPWLLSHSWANSVSFAFIVDPEWDHFARLGSNLTALVVSLLLAALQFILKSAAREMYEICRSDKTLFQWFLISACIKDSPPWPQSTMWPGATSLMSVSSYILSFLFSIHTGLATLSWSYQVHFCLRTFALSVPFAQKTFSRVYMVHSPASFRSSFKCYLLREALPNHNYKPIFLPNPFLLYFSVLHSSSINTYFPYLNFFGLSFSCTIKAGNFVCFVHYWILGT